MVKKAKKESREILLAFLFAIIVIAGPIGALSFAAMPISAQSTIATTQPQTMGANTETKTVIEFVDIPFNKTTVSSSSLPKGISKVTTVGVNGRKAMTYNVIYVNGAVTNKDLVSVEIYKQPIDEVTAVGAYVAPAKTLAATTTQPTPSPTPTPDPTPTCQASQVYNQTYKHCVPSNATALCNDNKYVTSTNESTACNFHKGVKEWYL